MSSTRNKRKRTENDSSAMAPASRRRSRDARAAADATEVANQKNEGEKNPGPDTSDDEGSTAKTADNTSEPQKDAECAGKHGGTDEKVTSTSASTTAKEESKIGDMSDTGTGSSHDASAPKQPLHVAAAADEATNTSTEDPDPDSNDRQSRLRDLIAHRSLLLSRIRLCRNAATKRLSETSRLAARNTGNKEQKAGVPSREMTDDEEIQAHREMRQLASLAAKKARGEGGGGGDGSAEKRTSLSLRRGSSVGKRMNAALSSLAPGVGPAAGTFAASPVALPASSLSSRSFPTATTTSASLGIPSGQAVARQKAPLIDMPQAPALPSGKSGKAASVQGHLTKQASLGGVDGKQVRPSGGKASKTNSGSFQQRTSSTGKVDQISAAFRPVHPHPNMPPRMPQPKTNFSEAMALRKKRDSVEAKLKTFLDNQKMQSGDVESFRRSAGAAGKNSRFSARSGLDIEAIVELPTRRKTHWDRLLQEMTWLASDFIEERKWKMSLARTISSAVATSGISTGSIAAARKSSKALATKADLQAVGDASKITDEAKIDPSFPIEERRYLKPSSEDLKESRKVGRLTSCMIAELVHSIHDEGTWEDTYDFHLEALDRYNKFRAKMLNDTLQTPNETVSSTASDSDNDKMKMKDNASEGSVASVPGNDAPDVTFPEISKRIGKLATFNGKKGATTFMELATAVNGKKLSLSDKQKEMIEFVDRIWTSSSAGAMLAGLPTSGKTVACCSLLWRHRTDGPQLVVCPPAGVLRWKYEVNLFKDLRALDFGFVGGIACPLKGAIVGSTEAGAGDVVICEYSLIGKMLALVRQKGIKFKSLCVDCRHPEGMFGTVGNAKLKLTRKGGWQGASEVIATDWWDGIISLVESDGVRRMVIDYCDPDPWSLSRSGLEPRQQLEVISLRAAFLVGPQAFRPSHYPLPRTVISWARHQGRRNGEDKFGRVRRVLQETISPFSICVRESLPFSSPSVWSVRSCEMPDAQRKAYDSCCSHIRGALASSLGNGNTQEDLGPTTYEAISTALLRLRKICLASSEMEMDRQGGANAVSARLPFVNKDPSIPQAMPAENVALKMSSDNSSQPDAELAEVLLTSSAKFVELVSIMQNECGYTLDCDNVVAGLLQSPRNGKVSPGASSRQKVAILAGLPRTQWLVSILLGSLGVRHKLIRRDFSHDPVREKDAHSKNKQTALAWAESQNTLVAFNCEENLQEKLGVYDSADVLIVSPDSLASWHGGVGIDNAHTVILLDEDWSGRELGTLEASIIRWTACTSMRKSSRQMIRLICENTIEEKLFEPLRAKGGSSTFEWPLDRSGNHLLYLEIEDLVPVYAHAMASRSPNAVLPGLRLLMLRGEPLGDVLLSTEEFQPLFGYGSAMIFLPLERKSASRDMEEVKRELSFLRSLFRSESIEATKDLSESIDSLRFARKHSFDSSILLPEPRNFLKHVMSRSDLKFLSIRYFLERRIDLSEQGFGSGGAALPKLSEAARSTPNTSGSLPEKVASDGSALADAWRKSGLGSKPDEMAKTLLFYRPINDVQNSCRASSEAIAAHPANRTRDRLNVYSHAYSTTWEPNSIRDGSQGSEPVVFFPPTYPKIQVARYASKQSKPLEDRRSGSVPKLDSSNGGVDVVMDPVVTQKRKEPEALATIETNSKRPRLHSTTAPHKNGAINPDAVPASGPISQKSDHENSLYLSSQKAQPSMKKEAVVADSSIFSSDEEEEDYGLLGAGVLPLSADSSLLLANEPTRVGGNARDVDFVQNCMPCDAEEAEMSLPHYEDSLQLIALFVKMRPRNLRPIRDHHGQAYRPHSGLPSSERRPLPQHPPAIEPLSMAASAYDINGDDAGKKTKKKATSQVAPSAFNTIPGTGEIRPTPTASTLHTKGKGKDAHKRRMLATYVSRQFGSGLSMFESASFRVAMMHVQNRVRARVERAQMASFLANDTGPGFSLQASNQPQLMTDVARGVVNFTSIVQQLKRGSHTGDAAKALATSQRSSLRRSLVSPCRVDFGPFGSGFFASPGGMTGISPPRSRLGVSLPMGVKVTQSSQDTIRPNWSAEEDKLLQEAAVRFGMNWTIVARSLSGFEGFVVTDANITGPVRRLALSPRSARQCRDRWQSLARSQPSLASEVRKSEKILRENALKRARSTVGDEDALIKSSSIPSKDRGPKRALLSKFSLYEEAEQENKMEIDPLPTTAKDTPSSGPADATPAATQPKRLFSVLKSAMAKRQVIPLSIPGLPPGGQPNQPVPSHPSHMQSVQSSVAAQWSNGRTEMWPLQILDCADKHRAAVHASAQRTSEKQTSAAPSSSSVRKPTSGSAVQQSSSGERLPPFAAAPPTGGSNRSSATQRTPTTPPSSSSPERAKPASDAAPKASSSSAKKAEKGTTTPAPST